MRQWRFIDHPPAGGAYNMGVDEAILTREGELPALRFYTWTLPCLSLGYGQRAADVDFNRLTALGWDVVRRPTGGRAILHTDELTYSLTLPLDHPIAAGGVIESYRRISRALMLGLARLGAATQSHRRSEQPGRAAAVCFETPSHYEITVGGRKLIGSAQVRRGSRLLQHGSLPLCGDISRICDALAYPDEAARLAAKSHVQTRAITLNDALGGRTITWRDAADALADGFREAFDVELVPADLTSAERDAAARLANEVYTNSTWTFRR